jgi:hypothetical protein
MFRFSRRSAAAVLAVAVAYLLTAAPASATITIQIKNSFIDRFANRATIDANVTIDAAASTPHRAAEDGDMHAAGRSSDIGFGTVVEIINARDRGESRAVTALKNAPGKQLRIGGYWRLWPEHGGSQTTFRQGESLDPFDTTNPNHAFEIHPMLSIAGIDLGNSLHPITGYQTKDATTAFQAYENEQCTITPTANDTTTIVTGMIGYNYVKFAVKLLEPPASAHKLDDGGFSFFADVYDPETGELVAHRVRMVVAPNTTEATTLASSRKGDALLVLGLPRIDLSLVKFRAANPDASQWTLPYEMILAGIYDETPELD